MGRRASQDGGDDGAENGGDLGRGEARAGADAAHRGWVNFGSIGVNYGVGGHDASPGDGPATDEKPVAHLLFRYQEEQLESACQQEEESC